MARLAVYVTVTVVFFSIAPLSWSFPLSQGPPQRPGRIFAETTSTKHHVAPSIMSTPQHQQQNQHKHEHQQKQELDLLESDASTRRAFLSTMVVATTLVVSSEANQAQAKELPTSSQLLAPSATVTSPPAVTKQPMDWNAVFQKASKKALGGGKAGASAAVVQVCSLMWLRTSMNYQYRYGGNLQSSLQELWQEGGIARLYQGLPFALVQGPLTRFGDTAANVGILVLLDSLEQTQNLPLPLKTAFGSVAAGLWRILLMPVDASKTAMQVQGADGLQQLWSSVASQGPAPLYRGAVAQAAATAVGHFPWFVTYNFLDAQLPVITASDDLLLSLCRSAVLGLSASCVSDCASNSLRVIKTTKQTAQLGGLDENGQAVEDLSYAQIVSMIIEKDGIGGLLGRGLQTRLLTNALQGAVFSVLWKYFQQTGVGA